MKKILVNILSLILLYSCSDGGSEDFNLNENNPESSILLFPEKDLECTKGTSENSTNSTVIFKWNKSANTDLYNLSLVNLKTNITTVYSTTLNQLSVEVSKATPYSWSVTSKSNITDKIAVSEVWRFYSAGDGVITYAPFPAQTDSPKNSDVVESINNKTLLDWNAVDLDNDILSYEVYFGTDKNPLLYKSGLSESTIEVSIVSGVNYFWYIITKDKKGNTSRSEIFSFFVK
jgi:hypothetical protein